MTNIVYIIKHMYNKTQQKLSIEQQLQNDLDGQLERQQSFNRFG